MAPWGNQPRHRTWASDTVLTSAAAVIVIAIYMCWELFGDEPAPQGMVTLVGLAGGALFGAVSRDKRKREDEVTQTAERAEAKADRLEREVHGDAADADDSAGGRNG
ncbi:hypothetical protein SEA_EVANESCE_34 [Mycobacterium phage Evanesce]|uniref:Uncharacterized protein n=16 Tax=Caudoviricetes TaxID=2731619 RepID=A0A385D0V5_9CAUD|nr:hypothetical protein Giles_34 [Mycobacterium phage Giles]AHY84219.1 hypothetical protein PBI_HH92_34 [Mycobacterium phage HH92]AKQ07811.1 hypothetical protein SEA_KINBOTE_35 [Mycobacterium phage Kinbote]ALA06679.1 hypothetical protein SEA_OBUpride_35 [Mycobacterium phage OBUpride]ALF00255.1 hypothetical protein SEA_EVANESCE_34 [Mycobacterium phage Evanesce]ATN90417.1 hypothetical protein SEA_LILHAZELNUT_35 [Mycobacterium phage LilHazelnut]AXQ51467.1 hypothetical protein SEA_AMOCHICK_35 [My